jgi:hypothetical protein
MGRILRENRGKSFLCLALGRFIEYSLEDRFRSDPMQRYEFKVIPAPRRAEKLRGVKTTEDRFALSLTAVMNDLGREGWDYLRADTLPVDERVGFTGSKTTYQNMLVFRRVLAEDAVAAPKLEEVAVVPRLGPAEVPAGAAPALGPATTGMAAE